MTITTLAEKAVVGRRVTFTYYRDLERSDVPVYPGIITGLVPDQEASVKVRLDGTRCNLHVRPGYEGLTYLDEVVPVPGLPMGAFIPFASDQNGFYEKAGVLLAVIGEDGEDYIVVTDDIDKARAAVTAYDEEVGVDTDYVDYDRLQAYWAVFTWEPEDAECPWTVRWDAAEGDEQAVHIYYLPA